MVVVRKRLLSLALVIGVLGALLVSMPGPVQALSGADFDPGYIISDQKFFDANSMSEAQIQEFLNSKVSSCSAGYTCLKDYRTTTFSRAAVEPGHCSAYTGEADELASRIIYKTAQACGISPQVLLVLLQKETSLVTSTSPSASTYRKAAGYGCPDTSNCDAAFYGFYNQIYKAAWQFRQYTNYPARQYRIGNVSIAYNPNAACGSSMVNIANQATANLYNYTPYQPNASALANLSGTGDSCGAYGNRNFWVFFNNWFGPPNLAGSPVANLDVFTAVPGGIRVAGWAWDPDTSNSIQVHIYVNGVGTAITASNDRPDVGATWPAVGSAHGFDVTLKATTEGPQNVCVYGINQGPGANTQIRCQTFPGMTGSPGGVLDSVTAVAGVITATGWTFDPDTSAPIPVHLYVDSVGTPFVADDSRTDVGLAYPAYGANHGYSRSVKASPGPHTVCAYGIESAGLGANSLLGCKSVTVASGDPIGVLDTVSVNPGTVTATGWVLDPDTTASTPVHVYSDAIGVPATADQPRSDVGAAYPGYGDRHGYSVTTAAKPGPQTVCAYGIDIAAPGGNRQLGCRTVQGMSGPPVGVVDSITGANGRIQVSGWAYDPDTAAPIPVHVYVDSVGAAFTAESPRPDVGAVYPAYGPNHGYSLDIAAAPGVHNVCVYGINTGPGGNALLGCKTVTS